MRCGAEEVSSQITLGYERRRRGGLVIAANSVQPCWFQFGRQPVRDRVFSKGKPSNAISLATAIFTGLAAVIYKILAKQIL
jgi:hypothetical protein